MDLQDLRKAAQCVFLATEEGPARDLSNKLILAADEIDSLRAQLEQAALAYQQDLQVKNVEIHVLNAQLADRNLQDEEIHKQECATFEHAQAQQDECAVRAFMECAAWRKGKADGHLSYSEVRYLAEKEARARLERGEL